MNVQKSAILLVRLDRLTNRLAVSETVKRVHSLLVRQLDALQHDVATSSPYKLLLDNRPATVTNPYPGVEVHV